MRRDLVIDGIAFGSATLEGDDATDSILAMYSSLSRGDINCLLLDGLVISKYNIIDGQRLATAAGVPVIAITFRESSGLENAIKGRFQNWHTKLDQYRNLGTRERVTLKTGKNLFIRYWGINQRTAVAILNAFTLQGSLPEPVRIAKLAARAALT